MILLKKIPKCRFLFLALLLTIGATAFAQKVKITGNFGHADQILIPVEDNQLGDVRQRRVHVLLQVEFINIAVDQFFRRYFFHGSSS